MYKNIFIPRGNVSDGVKARLEDSIKRRKMSRLANSDGIRNLPFIDIPNSISPVERKKIAKNLLIKEWKEAKKTLKKNAPCPKKPFVTGIVHHHPYYSPPPLPKTRKKTTSTSYATTYAPFKIPPPLKVPSYFLNLSLHERKKVATDILIRLLTGQVKKKTSSGTNSTIEPPMEVQVVENLIAYLKEKSEESLQSLKFLSLKACLIHILTSNSPHTQEITKNAQRKKIFKDLSVGYNSDMEIIGKFAIRLNLQLRDAFERSCPGKSILQEIQLLESAMTIVSKSLERIYQFVPQKLQLLSPLQLQHPEPAAVPPGNLYHSWDTPVLQGPAGQRGRITQPNKQGIESGETSKPSTDPPSVGPQ